MVDETTLNQVWRASRVSLRGALASYGIQERPADSGFLEDAVQLGGDCCRIGGRPTGLAIFLRCSDIQH